MLESEKNGPQPNMLIERDFFWQEDGSNVVADRALADCMQFRWCRFYAINPGCHGGARQAMKVSDPAAPILTV